MFFRRKTLPDGSARIDPDHAQIDMLDKWHQQESAWAAGYIQLLERHLAERIDRCQKCPYRNKEGSGCNDQIPD